MVPHCALHCCCLNVFLLQKLLGQISFSCSLDIAGVRTGKFILALFSPNRRQGAPLDFSVFFCFFFLLSHCSHHEVVLKPLHRDFILSNSFSQEKSLFFTRVLQLDTWNMLLISWQKQSCFKKVLDNGSLIQKLLPDCLSELQGRQGTAAASLFYAKNSVNC